MSAVLTYHNIGSNSNINLTQLPSIEIDSFHMQLHYLKFFLKVYLKIPKFGLMVKGSSYVG